MPKKSLKKQIRRHGKKLEKSIPLGVKVIQKLRGHQGVIGRIAWSPDGQILASPSGDGTIRLWNTNNGECIGVIKKDEKWGKSVSFDARGEKLAIGSEDGRVEIWIVSPLNLLHTLSDHEGDINSVLFDPKGQILASGCNDNTVKIWNVADGELIHTLRQRDGGIRSLAFDSSGKLLAVGGHSMSLTLWDVSSGRLMRRIEGHTDDIPGLVFDSKTGVLASSGGIEPIIRIWNPSSGRLIRTIEGHDGWVTGLSFSNDGLFLASKGRDEIKIWDSKSGVCVASMQMRASGSAYTSVSFHPSLHILAAVVSGDEMSDLDTEIAILELDDSILFQQLEPSAHYVNAKVVLVGDTGVGKSGLSIVLNNQAFEATDSTPGRRVWTFSSQEVLVGDRATQTRETLLWDLAGQPGYRVIHQLHLNEVAVALVVFDARSETDPLAGVRHWERALRLAQQRQGVSGVPMRKFLVSARNDRGMVSVSKERLEALIEEFNFDGYFETSAKEGWKIKELRWAIEQAIEWEKLPEVTSSQLFSDIKAFLLNVKKMGQLLAPVGQLYDEFVRNNPDVTKKVIRLREQFNTCIGRLENRDLIRQLTFGGYVLMQAELLDAYASAMVNAAKEEPDGLGSLAEEVALSGKFYVPKEQKVSDSGQEQLLLHATVEELVLHDLALRENADDGRYLVFPSQFNRDYEDAPEPKGKVVSITFDGPVQSLYSTLAVRLGHSGLFTTGRAEMWRNAAVFDAKAGGKCGLFLHEFAEGRGRLIIFFPDEHSSSETRFHFEEFVLNHAKRRALDNTVEVVRFFVCVDCGDPVPESYVKRLREKHKMEFNCPCGGTVSLAEPKERIHFKSKVEAMDQSADRHRVFDAFVMSAKGETSTKRFQDWAGGDHVTLAIVFTDVVGSTALGERVGDEAMSEIRRSHFTQSRRLIEQFKGREIKTIGDSFMAAFKSVCAALDYARALQDETGHEHVQIRAGIHIGPMQVEEGDVFGGTVNFAARVVGAVQDAEIWLSERAKEDVDRIGSNSHKSLNWIVHDGVEMKGFAGKWRLWELVSVSMG